MYIYIYIYVYIHPYRHNMYNMTAAWLVDREFVYIVVPACELFGNVCLAWMREATYSVENECSFCAKPYLLGR